jgi:hypothetical protein
MSALPPKAVIQSDQPNVRFAPKADIRGMDILQCDGRRFGPIIGQPRLVASLNGMGLHAPSEIARRRQRDSFTGLVDVQPQAAYRSSPRHCHAVLETRSLDFAGPAPSDLSERPADPSQSQLIL